LHQIEVQVTKKSAEYAARSILKSSRRKRRQPSSSVTSTPWLHALTVSADDSAAILLNQDRD
jgi:hypothetical protein